MAVYNLLAQVRRWPAGQPTAPRLQAARLLAARGPRALAKWAGRTLNCGSAKLRMHLNSGAQCSSASQKHS